MVFSGRFLGRTAPFRKDFPAEKFSRNLLRSIKRLKKAGWHHNRAIED
jgi:hypothetical protein